MRSTTPLKRLAVIEPGQSPPSDEVSDYLDEGLPFVQGNAEFGAIHPAARLRCDTAPKRALAGDILVSVRAPVGALNIADRSLGIGRGLAAIRLRAALDQRFLWWYMHASVDALRAMGSGSTYDAVSAEDVGALLIPMIPIAQQRVIADFLDTETARIDALITKKRRLVLRLNDRIDAVRQSSILGKVDPSTGKGALPAGWRRARLGMVARLQRGVDLPEQQRIPGDVPIVSSGGVSGRHNKAVVAGPGVVTGRYGTVGEVFWMESEYWPLNTTLYVRDFAGNDPRWVFHLLRALPLEIDADKSAVTGINRNVVSQLRVPLPPVTQQREIATSIDDITRRVQEVVACITRQITLLVEHRQALVTAAVTGDLEIHGGT
jgi:type I restriction enzyme, S subunit